MGYLGRTVSQKDFIALARKYGQEACLSMSHPIAGGSGKDLPRPLSKCVKKTTWIVSEYRENTAFWIGEDMLLFIMGCQITRMNEAAAARWTETPVGPRWEVSSIRSKWAAERAKEIELLHRLS